MASGKSAEGYFGTFRSSLMYPFLAHLIISFVLFLILFPVFTSQVFIIWPWYGREWTVELIILLVPFNVLALLLLWNYYLCISTDPGRVPDGWEPDVLAGEGYEVKKLTGGPRYCRTCEKYKPPRSHHCRQCNRCVLRMDHHCPWVNNCIGHFNYGHFIRFLFYVDVTCAYHLLMVTRRVMVTTRRKYYDDPSGFEFFCIVINYALVVPVILAVGAFSIYHLYNLTSNSTTIEGWEKDKAATLKRHGKIQEIKFPYDLGVWRNTISILGSNPLLWCCPTVPGGTGLKFQLSVVDGELYGFSASHQVLGQEPLYQSSLSLPVPLVPFALSEQGVDAHLSCRPDHDVEMWPPRDPTLESQKPFKLPDSPWTYDNGDINPALRPSNSRQRPVDERSSARAYTSALPPYHPDFEQDVYQSDTEPEEEPRGVRLRRGSEGYEVRPINREEMLQEYIQHEVERTGRYQMYRPKDVVDYEPDSRDEGMLSDDDKPLGLRD